MSEARAQGTASAVPMRAGAFLRCPVEQVRADDLLVLGLCLRRVVSPHVITTWVGYRQVSVFTPEGALARWQFLPGTEVLLYREE